MAHRVTRTTGETPDERFSREEKKGLKQLNPEEFELATWEKVKVHRDHHFVFKGSFYSVPTAYLEQCVWVRASTHHLKIYHDNQLIKIHPRCNQKGKWITDPMDYPEYVRPYLNLEPLHYLEEAKKIGESVYEFIQPFVTPLTRTQQRKIFAIFSLGKEFGYERLNQACKRALFYQNDTVASLKRILEKGLEKMEIEKEEKKMVSIKGAYLRNLLEFSVTGVKLWIH